MSEEALLLLCRTCGGATQGYKCDVCGAESPVHVESHRCGGPHCMPKCAECYEAEVLCDCARASDAKSGRSAGDATRTIALSASMTSPDGARGSKA